MPGSTISVEERVAALEAWLPKVGKGQEIKINLYRVLTNAVERGCELGWNRAHKHVDVPTSASIKDEIHTAIMSEISDFVDFNQEG